MQDLLIEEDINGEYALTARGTILEEAMRRTCCGERSDTFKALWVLFVFSYAAFLQAFLWLLPGTISVTLITVYSKSFTVDSIQLNYQVSSIAFLVMAIVAAYCMGPRLGLRGSIMITAALLTTVVVLRFCAQDVDATLSLVLWLLSSVLTGVSGPIPSALFLRSWFCS